MGEFDFTYRLPQNFSRRVVQYLEQLESPNVARAFQNCTYDYEDLGLAYYAGMKGDNWDKKALDFTVEGSPRDIALLKSKGHILKESISKSLKSSESGFLLKEIYYFESESVEPIPLSNAARLNADIASSQVVLRDLLQIGQRFCLNCSFNGASSENSMNDYFRDLLFMKGYTEIKDQTRHGLSVNKKDSAEVDILLTKDGKEIAIYYIYKSYGTALYREMLSVLVDAWGGDSDSFLSGILHGMARFLALYQGEYSRERLVLRLRTAHPKTITRLAQNDTGNVADRHMKQILSIYNGAGRVHSLPCKR